MLKFAMVNRAGSQFYIANYQRHHLIPIQAKDVFADLNARNSIGSYDFDIDNFYENGLLLPGNELEASKSGLPMHRGPHPRYNDLVIERVIQVLRHARRFSCSLDRDQFIDFRIKLLQNALRQSLIKRKLGALVLNKRDPFGYDGDYQTIDTMVDRIWCATEKPK